MKKLLAWSALPLMLALVLGGCATSAVQGPSNAELLDQTLATLARGVEMQDIDLMMSTFSEGFAHPQVGDKAAGRGLLQLGLDAGYGAGAKLDLSDASTEWNEDTATVYPVALGGDAGVITLELVLTKEADGVFRITTLAAEGV